MDDYSSDSFSEWLQYTVTQMGGLSAAAIRLNNPLLKRRIAQNNRYYAEWLRGGFHAQMDYLREFAPQKADLLHTFPKAKSVIVLCFDNRWGELTASHPFPAPKEGEPLGYISSYAKEADYHRVAHQLLKQLHVALEERCEGSLDAEMVVDTKPVYERLLAIFGGLGVRGQNDLLRVPEKCGSRVFIASLFVDRYLPEVIHFPQMPFACMDCLSCLNHCPTGAIRLNKPFNATHCISYLTIEKRTPLNREEGQLIDDWLFGCDGCTAFCPPCSSSDQRIPVDLGWLMQTSAGALKRLIAGTSLAYGGVTQLRKNAVVILKKRDDAQSRLLLDWVRKNSGSNLIRRQIALW